jgi:hypothetical protein
MGTIFLFIPWFFILKWSARATVWSLFGPWMKLVDIYYVSQIKPATETDLAQKARTNQSRRKNATYAAVVDARVKKENEEKLKAMKAHMFGKFVVRVPILKEDRYRDLPLPESFAVPYQPEKIPLSELAMAEAGYHRSRLPGQFLVGDMIPRIEAQGFTEAPIGEATAHPRLVDKKGPGGSFSSGVDSTFGAYTKISSLVALAAVLTWFGVPAMSLVSEEVLKWALSIEAE